MTEDTAPYARLIPDTILAAVESIGLRCTGHILALNSYENRVYQIGVEDSAPVVVKFYRPARWTDAAIIEEHEFVLALEEQEIPVVAPLRFDSRTLLQWNEFRFSVFPRRGGRWPDLDNPDNLMWMGRFLARIHAVGATRPYLHRPSLSIDTFGTQPVQYLLTNDTIPSHLRVAYETLTRDLLKQVTRCFEHAGNVPQLRLHGDCHPGNILWTDSGPHFVDFDDSRMGPAIQDLWMLLSGTRDERAAQIAEITEGYNEFYDFDPRQLHLIEALRTLRMIHYAAWLAQRWNDPAFPLAFPWFASPRYWEEHILALREQAEAMDVW